MTQALSAALEELHLALAHEYDALLTGDPDALVDASREKLLAVQQVEALRAARAEAPLDAATRAFIAEIAAKNRSNGALIAAGQRSTQRSLVRLGRMTLDADYDDAGRPATRVHARHLGAA